MIFVLFNMSFKSFLFIERAYFNDSLMLEKRDLSSSNELGIALYKFKLKSAFISYDN